VKLLADIEQSIRDRKLLRRGQKILVAVSGGVDSMVLLHVLHRLSKKNGWQLTVAHLNHKLRGRSSDADEQLVHTITRKLHLRLVSENADVRAFAREHKLSIEMAARKLRHDFLARTAVRLKIPAVALAHHADDQVELFFLRLLRGSGGEGLSGMKWRGLSPGNPKVELVRPLLEQPKLALRRFARVHQVRFREDKSNARLDIQRNRIRHELLPLLKRHYQPALEKMILRVMEIVGAESEFAGRAAQDWLKGKGQTPFEKLSVAVQRRGVQLQLQRLGIVPGFDLVEKLCAEPGSPISISPELFALRDDSGQVRLRKSKSGEAGAFGKLDSQNRLVDVWTKSGAGEISFGGAQFRWRLDSGKALPRRRAARTEFFDADKVGSPVVLRHWQPGDRFQPIGMKHSVKLQDLFTNQKVPRAVRRALVVATTVGGEVVWVEGLRIAERFKLTAKTAWRLKWFWHRH
jgi:tRNA(Ile)-lysidine synthase